MSGTESTALALPYGLTTGGLMTYRMSPSRLPGAVCEPMETDAPCPPGQEHQGLTQATPS